MNITPEEMTLILERRHGRPARRMMRLPVTHTGEAIERKCPVRRGESYKLSDGERETYITVIEEPRRERLGEMSYGDARREGYDNPIVAMMAFVNRERMGAMSTANGLGREVWVIAFEHTENERLPSADTPVFLSGDGGYTTVASLQSVPGDPEVVLPSDGEGERARVLALAHREAPTREQIEALIGYVGELRETMLSMKDRNRLALIAKELSKLSVAAPPVDALRSARAAG